jgi:hypothetical protein
MRPTESAFIPICQSEVWRNFIGWFRQFAKALLNHEANLSGVAAFVKGFPGVTRDQVLAVLAHLVVAG